MWALSRLEPQPRVVDKSQLAAQFPELRREALELGHMFEEPFRTLVEATDPKTAFVLPARDKKPFAHGESLAGVVFIGDANHAVSPFAGNGANIALKDGWDLADAICREASLEAAVSAYDKISVSRADRTLKVSHQRIVMGHCTGAKYALLRGGPVRLEQNGRAVYIVRLPEASVRNTPTGNSLRRQCSGETSRGFGESCRQSGPHYVVCR